LYNSLVTHTWAVEPEPKFPALAPQSKSFWLWIQFQPFKIAWDQFLAPAPHPCSQGSTKSENNENETEL